MGRQIDKSGVAFAIQLRRLLDRCEIPFQLNGLKPGVDFDLGEHEQVVAFENDVHSVRSVGYWTARRKPLGGGEDGVASIGRRSNGSKAASVFTPRQFFELKVTAIRLGRALQSPDISFAAGFCTICTLGWAVSQFATRQSQ